MASQNFGFLEDLGREGTVSLFTSNPEPEFGQASIFPRTSES